MFKPKLLLIEFGVSDSFIDPPKPAQGHIPDWYKKSPKHRDYSDNLLIESPERAGNKGLKYCMPFLDSMTNGYIGVTWQDLQVERTLEGSRFHWQLDPPLIEERTNNGFEHLPIPAGHVSNKFAWKNPFSVKTPPGYSILLTHPLNRFDLPFTTLSGIDDSDNVMPPGNLPFYLREDFEGIIPKGTPFVQFIPIKRDNWKARYNQEIAEEGRKRVWQSLSTVGYYKNNFWNRKSFQ